LEEENKNHTRIERNDVEFMLFIYGLVFPLYEIVTLASVIATVVDPLWPSFNTTLSLLAPAVAAFVFSLMFILGNSGKERKRVFYLFVSIFIIIFCLLYVDSYIPIAGYVDDTNLWTLVTVNVAVYILAAVLAIVSVARTLTEP
jgi:hypothetical protein